MICLCAYLTLYVLLKYNEYLSIYLTVCMYVCMYVSAQYETKVIMKTTINHCLYKML